MRNVNEIFPKEMPKETVKGSTFYSHGVINLISWIPVKGKSNFENKVNFEAITIM